MTYKIPGSNVELSDDEVKELRQVFDMVDKDKGGSIDANEVKELMEMLGMHPTMTDVTAMIADIDKDASGTIDFDEFLQLTYCTDKHGLEDNEILRLIHTQETSSDGRWINFADRINVFMNK